MARCKCPVETANLHAASVAWWLQVHVEAMPDGKKNPYGNGFVSIDTPLTSEGKACRVADASKGTHWKVNNPASRHTSTGRDALLQSMHLLRSMLSGCASHGCD